MNNKQKIWGFAAVAAIGVGSLMSWTQWGTLGHREELLLDLVTEGMERMHYQPEKIDDDFSLRVYDLFLKDMDGNKLFFTKKDMAKMDKYKKSIDDQINEKSFDFYNLALNTRNERLKQAEVWYKELLAQPLDFTNEESYEADDDKRGYSADEADLKNTWRKYLEYQVVARYSDMLEDEEKRLKKAATPAVAPATDAKKDAATKKEVKILTPAEMEAEARKKVMKVMDDWFKRLRGVTNDEVFSIYLNAIASSFDPHSNYMAPEQKKDFDINMSGKLEGIGATLQTKDSYVRVTSLVPGGPAWKGAKLKVDDLIMKVAQSEADPVDVTDMPINDVIKMIRGKKGTEVRLTVKKTDGSVAIVPITRDIVELEDGFAKSSVIQNEGLPKIGYISLPRFYADFDDRNGRRCSKDMKKELEKLKAENVEGIVLDLRGNGGGSLNDVVEIGGFFIDKGPIVQVKGRESRPEQLNDVASGVIYDGPLVIMTDMYSASASEILAAAMQDYGRAVIIGSKSTFGKGTVQRFIELDRYAPLSQGDLGPLGSVKLTTQKFYRINGGTTQLKGVIPDIILPDTYALIDKYGEKEESYPLQWDEIPFAPHKDWDGLRGIIANIKTLSAARIAKDKHFLLIQEGAKRLKTQRDNTNYSVNLKKYQKQQKEFEEAAKPLRDSNNEPLKGITVLTPKADEAFINVDSSRITRHTEWQKQIKKDIYIHESCNVISDIVKNVRSTPIAKKDNK